MYYYRYLKLSDWISLAASLSLLSQSRPVSSTAPLLADQLDYLLDGQAYLAQCKSSLDIPSNPLHVSRELWSVLHKLPLSVSYFERVLHSTSTHTQFWEPLDGNNHNANVEDFPWKSSERDSSLTGLEDLVVLRCFSEKSYFNRLNALTTFLLETVEFPLLSSVLAEWVELKRPLLILYNANSLVSQVNHYHLKETLRNTLKVCACTL